MLRRSYRQGTSHSTSTSSGETRFMATPETPYYQVPFSERDGIDDPEISLAYPERYASNIDEALDALSEISQKEIINAETGIRGEIHSEQKNKLVSSKAREKSNKNGFTNEEHFIAVANIDRLFENSNLVSDRPDQNGDPNIISIKRFVAPILLGNEFAEAYITVKETVGNKIYSIELDELKKPSDIQGGTLKERYHIPEGYHRLLQKIEKARNLLQRNRKNLAVLEDDAAYLEAVKRGDMETAQRMVNAAYLRAGYSNDVSYRMNHTAPNRQDLASDPNGPVQCILDWNKIVPKDYLDHPEWYVASDMERRAHRMIRNALESGADGITMYRAVARNKNRNEGSFRNGDWITPLREYAKGEGEINGEPYRIIEQYVPLKNIFWDGNSPAEFGFDDGKNYVYADTKNNRKLADAVTYDDNGEIIPLSKRFNKRNNDVRFMVNENGQSLFQVQGKQGNLTAEEILSDKSIKPSDFILTDQGQTDWGYIPQEVAEAGKKYGVEAFPIRLCKGEHFGTHAGYGLAHFYIQHGKELSGKNIDISDMLWRIFNRPSEILVRSYGNDLYLEVVHNSKPREVGIIQLRKADGFYSIVTAFNNTRRDLDLKGDKIWKFVGREQTNSKQRTDPVEPLMGEKLLHPTLEWFGSKFGDNIDPFGFFASIGNKNFSEIRFSLAERSNEELGNELARFCLPLVEKRLDHQSIRDVVETALLEQEEKADKKAPYPPARILPKHSEK